MTDEDRFWAKVNTNGPLPIKRPELGPCWTWDAAITPEGYGVFNYHKPNGIGVRDSAHTWAYRQYVGPVPPKHQVDHLCHTVDIDWCDDGDNCLHRACVNYERHLEAVTPAENTMRSRSWAATKKRQVVCLRSHLLVSPNLLAPRLPHRACKSCAYTYPLRRKHNATNPTSEFDFQATSDAIYNRIMHIIPEQRSQPNYKQLIRPSAFETLEAVENMIRNLGKL